MFHDPIFLTLLLLVPIILWWTLRGRQRQAVVFSSALSDLQLPRSWRQRIAWLPTACTVVAFTLMIVAMARPREGREQTVIDAEGIAIEMVVDRSSSMQARDFRIAGRSVDRLTAIKNVAGRFVTGNSESIESDSDESPLSGRISDLVGLITFAGFADAVTPPTLDHGFLVSQLNNAEIVSQRSEDGTAIGDALSLAVEKLDSLDRGKEEKIESKVIILLTDGENTAGEVEPLQAADMAKAMGVKVYSVGVGTRGVAPVPTRHPFTGEVVLRNMEVNIDEETLNAIADATGGKYFRATDTKSLESIYAEIDEMEKTKVESQSFVDYREIALQSVRWGGWNIPPLLLVAVLLLAVRVILVHTLLQEFP